MTRTTTSQPDLAAASGGAIGSGPLVVAVGGSDPESVLRAAHILAPASAAGVVAVSVLAPLPVTIPGEGAWIVPTGYEEDRFADCMARLATRLEAFGGDARSWSRKVVRGSPPVALADLARERDAALLVIGIGRHRALDRIFGTETALRAIRSAPCPVLVVHPDFVGPFHDVVIATDFSPASVAAARAVLPMLSPAATLHVVHVWEPSASSDTRHAAADAAYAAGIPDSFRRFVERLTVPSGVAVKTATREGRPVECVLDYAAAHHADLITAGRHGRNLLQRILVGSHTTALLRAAERSVLIAPEPPFPERGHLQLMLTGSTKSTNPAEWESQLHALSARSHGRPTVLEVDDPMFNAQVVESGYVLLGLAYDPVKRQVEITLGDAAHGARRVARAIGAVESLVLEADETGRDVGLRISHGGGQTLLTFLGD